MDLRKSLDTGYTQLIPIYITTEFKKGRDLFKSVLYSKTRESLNFGTKFGLRRRDSNISRLETEHSYIEF
jgi:hypothetical protein